MKHRLAAPFVVTVGLMSTGCPSPEQPPPNTVVDVPQGVGGPGDGDPGDGEGAGDTGDTGDTGDGDTGDGDTGDGDPSGDPALAASERVEKRADGTCWRYADVECPPSPATCNPPPPQKVDCPAGVQ